jgi:predicted Zn-dependent protease
VSLIQKFLFALAALLSLAQASLAQNAQALVAQADDHYFNLEYDEALRDYYAAMAASKPSGEVWNRIATTILYQELNRLGMLETSAFRGDNEFLIQEKPKPDPDTKKRFFGALAEARRLAEADLKQNPKAEPALFVLSQNYALEANYQFMIDKSYIAALRAGNKARKYSDELREIDPDYIDAYLVAGVQEYVVGSLPWAVRALVAFGGIHGSKEKGRTWVERVADDGTALRTEARVLLALLYRREKRPLDAAKVLEGLIAQFPRNYVLRLELASMYLDAGERDKGLSVLLTADRMANNNENHYGRMPQRLREALSRKIKTVREELQETPRQSAYQAVYPGRVRAVAPALETLTST